VAAFDERWRRCDHEDNGHTVSWLQSDARAVAPTPPPSMWDLRILRSHTARPGA
jgi:hypothetical protein